MSEKFVWKIKARLHAFYTNQNHVLGKNSFDNDNKCNEF